MQVWLVTERAEFEAVLLDIAHEYGVDLVPVDPDTAAGRLAGGDVPAAAFVTWDTVDSDGPLDGTLRGVSRLVIATVRGAPAPSKPNEGEFRALPMPATIDDIRDVLGWLASPWVVTAAARR